MIRVAEWAKEKDLKRINFAFAYVNSAMLDNLFVKPLKSSLTRC